jgi:hypothetical protein
MLFKILVVSAVLMHGCACACGLCSSVAAANGIEAERARIVMERGLQDKIIQATSKRIPMSAAVGLTKEASKYVCRKNSNEVPMLLYGCMSPCMPNILQTLGKGHAFDLHCLANRIKNPFDDFDELVGSRFLVRFTNNPRYSKCSRF